MALHSRISTARRYANLTQEQLATRAGVSRSAVGHWERRSGRNPTNTHMRRIARATGVQFEWLATGRGVMPMPRETVLDSVPAADAILVEEELEMRLIHAFRHAPPRSHVALVEVVEHLALLRAGTSGRRRRQGDP